MKEFQKWLFGSEPKLNGRPREDAWRAALELVLGWLDYSSEHEEIKDKIHDELESD